MGNHQEDEPQDSYVAVGCVGLEENTDKLVRDSCNEHGVHRVFEGGKPLAPSVQVFEDRDSDPGKEDHGACQEDSDRNHLPQACDDTAHQMCDGRQQAQEARAGKKGQAKPGSQHDERKHVGKLQDEHGQAKLDAGLVGILLLRNQAVEEVHLHAPFEEKFSQHHEEKTNLNNQAPSRRQIGNAGQAVDTSFNCAPPFNLICKVKRYVAPCRRLEDRQQHEPQQGSLVAHLCPNKLKMRLTCFRRVRINVNANILESVLELPCCLLDAPMVDLTGHGN
mmetsp:Transcript_39806/g.92113  ORF Transcript_39806/g.92113 Transcript_39806/m.92113 type:complete len:278 (-) Transcript_39806:60-893(-)